LRFTDKANSVALPEDPDIERRHFSKIGQSESEERASSYTIAHISDPHLSRRYYREHIKSLKILLRSILEAGCDHVVISGDIVSTADPDDFFLAREVFANLGLLDTSRLTVVPGNHDIFGGPHRALDVLSFPSYIRSVDYKKNLALFHEAFSESFENVVPLIPGELYPFIKRAGPYSILGLNSIPPWSLLENPLGTNGIVDERQVSALKGLIGANEFVGSIPVVAVHHHFNDLVDASTESGLWLRIESKTMRLKKRRKLLKLFATLGVKYVFHGHIHRNELYERNGIQLANGAGAVCDDPVANLKYNMVMQNNGTTELKTNHLPIPYQSSTVMQKIKWRPRRSAVPALKLELSGK
jgi:3',5'-cyclic AMP phosphodiesterase CpdA